MSNECLNDCVVFVPSPEQDVRNALQKANLRLGETFVELGCGTGENLRMAVQEFHAREGIGYELNHERAEAARRINQGLPVTIHEETFMNAGKDIEKASVVYVYLLQGVNQIIKPLLEKHLKPNAKVVSRHYTFDGWEKDFSLNNTHIYLSHPTTNVRIPMRMPEHDTFIPKLGTHPTTNVRIPMRIFLR